MAYSHRYSWAHAAPSRPYGGYPHASYWGLADSAVTWYLAYALLVDYDGWRFQIEFNFRDAKQSWGLEDSMNVTHTGVTKAVHLSLFMVNVAHRLRIDGYPHNPCL